MASRDSFNKVPVAAPTRVDQVEVIFRVRPPTAPAVANEYDGTYSFDQKAADGTIIEVRSGTLLDKLTAPQLTAIKNFMDAILVKAQGTI